MQTRTEILHKKTVCTGANTHTLQMHTAVDISGGEACLAAILCRVGFLCTCIALWLPEARVPRQDALQQPGEGRQRGVDRERGGRKYRPNYGAALMRNVSTIQLLLSKYLMWTFSFGKEFVLPWKCMRAYIYACVCTFVCVCVCLAGLYKS